MARVNSWLVRAMLLAAFFLAAGPVGADLEPPLFYEMRVVLTTNEVIPAEGWGTFGGPSSQRTLRLFEVERKPGRVRLTLHFADAGEPLVHDLSVAPEASQLEFFEGHRRFDVPPNRVFFLPHGERTIPLIQVQRVEYVRVIGRGFRIAQDPSIFQSVPEPFLAVDDCGLGCVQKLRSHDGTVTRELLQKLWSEHFSCEERGRFLPHSRWDGWGDPEKFAFYQEHQLELVRDPTCID